MSNQDQEINFSDDDGNDNAGDFVIDFSEVPDDLIPDGKYNAEIVAAKGGTSKKGLPKIDMRYKIISGEFANRQILETMSLAPARMAQVKKALMVLGLSDGKTARFRPEDMVGKICQIVVGKETSTMIDPDTGDPYPPRNRIKSVRKAATESVESLLS